MRPKASEGVEEEAPTCKPALLRVKRKLGDEAAGEIIVSTSQAPPPKRQHQARDELLLHQLFAATSISTPPVTVTQKRFRRVRTIGENELKDKTAKEIRDLVDSWTASTLTSGRQPGRSPPDSGQDRKPAKDAASRSGIASFSGQKDVLRSEARSASNAGRYQQVRSKRHQKAAAASLQPPTSQSTPSHTPLPGASTSAPANSAPDDGLGTAPLRELFHLYDIVCTDAGAGERGAAEAAIQKAARAEARKKAQRAAEEEGAIMMNFMPMVREYLELQEDTAGGHSSAATTKADQQQKADVRSSMDSGQEEDEFVYDVYVPVDEDGDEGAREEGREGCSSHMGSDVPVVEVEEEEDEDGFWDLDPEMLALAAADHDSEDSNAESFYANSYPDDENGVGMDYSDSDEDNDDEAPWVRESGRGCGGKLVSDDEEYDLTTQDSDEETKVAAREACLLGRGPTTRSQGLPPSSSNTAAEWGHRIR